MMAFRKSGGNGKPKQPPRPDFLAEQEALPPPSATGAPCWFVTADPDLKIDQKFFRAISLMVESWRVSRHLLTTAEAVAVLKQRGADEKIIANYPSLETEEPPQMLGLVCDTMNELCAAYNLRRYSGDVAKMQSILREARDYAKGITPPSIC